MSWQRLYPPYVWFEKHTQEQRYMLIAQLDSWRTLPYKDFKRLACFNGFVGREPVYHIGQLPLKALFFSFYQLTPMAANNPLSTLQFYLLRRAESHQLIIKEMLISKKQDGEGLYYWQGMIEFEDYCGIRPSTFEVPEQWSEPSKKRFSPIWTKHSAIKYIYDGSIGPVHEYIRKESVQKRQIPVMIRHEEVRRPPEPIALSAYNSAYYPEVWQHQYKVEPSYEVPPMLPPKRKHEQDDDHDDQEEQLSDEQQIIRVMRLIEGPDLSRQSLRVLQVLLRRINRTMTTFRKRFRGHNDLFDQLRKRSREVVKWMKQRP